MSEEFRRAHRRDAPEDIEVIDTMTDQVVGRLGNVSETGMLLISETALVDDGLYQLRFQLPQPEGPALDIEVGAHLLWQNGASAPGNAWLGFRFITLTGDSHAHLRLWLEQPH